MARRVAVVGAGMTRFVRRAQETGKELAWEASREALASCELPLDRIDAVCLTSAPDAFDGVHMKGEYLSDGAGAFGRPFIRTYVGGGSGVFTAIQAYYTVASGMADVVLAVAEEKMSSTQPHPQGAFLTIFDNILERPLGPNLLWIFALEMNRYMTVHGIDKRDIAAVAVKNKRNAADHPAALLGQADITIEDVLASETLAWPVQRLDVSPISDGAVAIVVASEEAAKQITGDPVWIQGVGWNLDTAYWTNRDLVFPEYVANAARMAYGMAGVTEPRKQIHVAEPYDPFDYKELHHLEGLLLFDKGKAPEAARDGVLDRKGDLPSCPSGGLLGVGNPIAAAGLAEDRRALLAAPWGGGRPPGPGNTRTRRRAGLGRPHAGQDRRGDGSRGRPADDGDAARDAARRDAGDVALGRRVPLGHGRRRGRDRRSLRLGCGRRDRPVPRRPPRGQDPRPRVPRVPSGTRATSDVLRARLPRNRRLGAGRDHRRGADVLDLQCPVGYAPLDEPELPAVIAIDGSNGGFLHTLGEVGPDGVRIGMKVEAVWKPVGGAPARSSTSRTSGHGGTADAGEDRTSRTDPAVGGGPAGSPPLRRVSRGTFFTALKERGVLLGSRCESCAYTYVPARLFCERCFSELSADTEVGPGGELVSFTIVFRGIEGEPLDRPQTLGAVRLDGADAVLIHRVEPSEEPLEIGERVEVVVEPEPQRTGSILDIAGFGSSRPKDVSPANRRRQRR